MNTADAIAYALATVAATVLVTALVATGRAFRADRRTRRQQRARTFPIARGQVTVTAPMSEADYEALKTRWLKEHGSPHAAHHVTELKPHQPEEGPS